MTLSAPQIGKTAALACWLLAFGWEHPGVLCWWAAPTYKQDVSGFRSCRMLARSSGILAAASESRMNILLSNGTEVQFVSWDNPENLSGPTVSAMVIDEAHLLTRRAWKILRARTASTLGPIRMIGNTGDVEGEFKVHCDYAADPGSPWGFHHWTYEDKLDALGGMSTLEGRAYRDFIEEERDTSPRAEFEAIWLAVWEKSAAQIFSNVDGWTTQEVLEGPIPGVKYACGWDIAEEGDFTAGFPIPIPTQPNQVRTVRAMERFHRQGIVLMEQRIATFGQKWNVTRHWIEANNMGLPILEHLAAAGVPVQEWWTTNQSKHDATRQTIADLEHDRLRLAPLPPLQKELKSIRKKRTSTGLPRYEAKGGGHDDTYMGLIIANHASKNADLEEFGWV